MGILTAISSTASNSPSEASASSSTSVTTARTRSAYPATARRVNGWVTARRSAVCSGGSTSIIDLRASSASGSRSSSAEAPICEEYVSTSRETSTMSSYRVIDQKPRAVYPGVEGSGIQCTGSCRRRCAK